MYVTFKHIWLKDMYLANILTLPAKKKDHKTPPDKVTSAKSSTQVISFQSLVKFNVFYCE